MEIDEFTYAICLCLSFSVSGTQTKQTTHNILALKNRTITVNNEINMCIYIFIFVYTFSDVLYYHTPLMQRFLLRVWYLYVCVYIQCILVYILCFFLIVCLLIIYTLVLRSPSKFCSLSFHCLVLFVCFVYKTQSLFYIFFVLNINKPRTVQTVCRTVRSLTRMVFSL